MAPEREWPQVRETVRPSHPLPVVEPALLNSAGSDTQWTNLGFWRDGPSYPEAARALARRVGEAAKLRTGDVVLDCACGHGDSLALWIREFGAARVIGVEPAPAVAAIARKRVAAWGLADRVTILTATAESLVPERDCPGATAIVCVDAAYHFHTRAAWLTRVAQGMPGKTRFGLADLLVSHRARRGTRLPALALRAGIPDENLWTADEVEPVLAECGIALDRLVRCSGEVLGGFARHALLRTPLWLARPGVGGWRALSAAMAIAFAGGGLDYAIISAHAIEGGKPLVAAA